MKKILKKFQLLKVALFDEKTMRRINTSMPLSAFLFILLCAILAFPTDKIEFNVNNYLKDFLIIVTIILITQMLVFLMLKFWKSEIKIQRFFTKMNTALIIATILVSVPLGIISYLISLTSFKTSFITLVFSLVPFYNFVFFGWCSEELSGFKGMKGIATATISMLIFFFAHYYIGVLT